MDETFTEMQEERYSSEAMTTSGAVFTPSAPTSSLSSFKSAHITIGILGTLTNGIVLVGFCFSGRSKMTSSRAHIANHTTLEQLPVRHCLALF